MDSRLAHSQGESVPESELRPGPGGPFPASTDRNGRPYLPDSAISAHGATLQTQFARQAPRWPRLLPPSGSTSRDLPWSQFVDHRQDAPEEVAWHRHLGHLEHRVARVSDDLGANLHNLLAKRGQRPAFDLIWENQRAEEVGHVVRQRMKLEADRVGLH